MVKSRQNQRLESKLADLPAKPGCYLFKDGKGVILYVGKAKDLKKRVRSYFQRGRGKNQDPKTQALVARIEDVDIIITASEKGALVLENTLIKRHQPHYNIDLKDSRRYAYLLRTEERFPRLLLARDKQRKGKYFGPFTSAEKRDTLRRFATNVFRIRTCNRLPKKACLRLHMDLCDAPCVGMINAEAYGEQVRGAEALLSGKAEDLVKEMEGSMKAHAADREYEAAMVLRDRIRAVDWLREKQVMETQRSHDQDVIHFLADRGNGMIHLAVFRVYKGVLAEKQEFDFAYSDDFLEEFLLQYYELEPVPKEIILPKQISQTLYDYLEERSRRKLKVTVPRRGDKRKLLEVALTNVEKSFKEDELALMDLQKRLQLDDPPRAIECFDVSHLGGTSTTASMVRFAEGKPDKSGYRRFKIRSVDGGDDFAAMGEVVGRRYRRLIKEGAQMPDLIVIDGGKGQLRAALDQLSKLGLSIPTISLAKRDEEIYVPGLRFPIKMSKRSRGLRLLQRVRDEAHRFALSYQKILRSKRVVHA